MSVLDKSTAESFLDPILSLIEQCFTEAWAEWSVFYAPKHHVLDGRARASIMYCHVVDRALILFRGVDGVTPGRKNGIFRLFVGDEIALRFKKAKRNGTTSNVSTYQQRLIDMQITIPGILPGTMLNAVYQLNDLERDIARMMVTHQLDGKVQWSIEIKRPVSGDPIQMPAPSTPPAPVTDRVRVKGKHSRTKESAL